MRGTISKEDKGAEKLSKKALKKGTDVAFKAENLGKLELTVSYNGSTLEVFLGQAKGLKSSDIGKGSDPYAKVYLIQHSVVNRQGLSRAAVFEKGHEQTKTHKKNLNPIFNEGFKFMDLDPTLLNTYAIVVAIWDWDMISKDDYLGGIRIPLMDFNYDVNGHLNKKIMVDLLTHDVDGHPLKVVTKDVFHHNESVVDSYEKRTSVTSSSSYASSIKEKTQVQSTIMLKVSYDGALRIFLYRAKGLKDTDFLGKTDPYAMVSLIDQSSSLRIHDYHGKKKTKVQKDTMHPEFNEEFEFQMDQLRLANMKVVIEIFDDDLGKDDYVAGVMFSLASFHWNADYEFTISLSVHRQDGLPKESYEVMKFGKPLYTSKFVTKPRSRSSSSSSSSSSDDDIGVRQTIYESNNKLVEYVGNMRILKEAHNIRQSIPDEITINANERKSVNYDIRHTFDGSMRSIFGDIESQVKNANNELERLRAKNRELKAEYEEKERLLSVKDQAIWTLENELINIQSKFSRLEYEVNRITQLEQGYEIERNYYNEQINTAEKLKKQYNTNVIIEEIETKERNMAIIVDQREEEIIKSSAQKIKIPITVFSEFKNRLMMVLDAKRKEYLSSVNNLNIETERIMEKYDEIIKIKKRNLNPAPLKRALDKFVVDKANLEMELAGLRKDLEQKQLVYSSQKSDHEIQVQRSVAEFKMFRDSFEKDIKHWFDMHKLEYNKWSKEQFELTIYEALLDIERGPGPSGPRGSLRSARVKKETRSSSHGMSSGPIHHLQQDGKFSYYSTTGAASTASYVTGGSGFQYATTNIKNRKESGYHSPAPTSQLTSPVGTLGRDSSYSTVFNAVKQDIGSDSEMHI